MATAKDAMGFVLSCIGQAEADGYQQFEEDGGEVPEGDVPDDYMTDGARTLWLRFGDDIFEVVARKKSPKTTPPGFMENKS